MLADADKEDRAHVTGDGLDLLRVAVVRIDVLLEFPRDSGALPM